MSGCGRPPSARLLAPVCGLFKWCHHYLPTRCVCWQLLSLLRTAVPLERGPALTTSVRMWTLTLPLANCGRWPTWTCTQASRSETKPSFTTRGHIQPAIHLDHRLDASTKLSPPHLRTPLDILVLCSTQQASEARRLPALPCPPLRTGVFAWDHGKVATMLQATPLQSAHPNARCLVEGPRASRARWTRQGRSIVRVEF